jgi:CheY-like chemotaxis protein
MQYPERSVLVVDDGEANRDMLARRLQKSGYQVTTAASGAEALRLLALERHDIILLDILMPELDGYQTLEKIKANPVLRDIPVIMVTAVTDIDSVTSCITLGAEDYIVKPIDFGMLQSRIWHCLAKASMRNRNLDPAKSRNGDGGSTILVVDDVELNRFTLAARLKRGGYVAELAGGAREAWQVVRSRPIDLILLDLRMPEIDGFQFLAELKSDVHYKDIPVIIVSAEDDTDSMARALNLGAADYIVKPFHAQLLKSRIDSCIADARLSHGKPHDS